MARKLGLLVAVLGLAILVLAPVSFATTYDLGQQGDDSHYTWFHNYTNKNPWDAGTEFVAGGPDYFDSSLVDSEWKIGFNVKLGDFLPYTNTVAGTHTTVTEEGSTYDLATIVFDTTAADPKFYIDRDGYPYISSTDTILTYNVKYLYSTRHTVIEGTVIGEGTNSDGTPFMFTLSLEDSLGNHQNLGYITSFTLEYPYNGSPVPVPGAVWLLGSGLVGLFCLGRRRKK